MKFLFKNATIIDTNSKHNGKITNVLIEDGKIVEIKKKIEANDAEIIHYKGLCLSPGWVDVGTQICDPGFEHREDLETASAAAAAGGFTTVLAQPNTSPAIQSKSEVLYLQQSTKEFPVTFQAIGALSADINGENITEMADMNAVGAIAFSDGKKSVQSTGLLMRAMQYVKAFNGIIINHPNDKEIAGKGQMHEGYISTTLGLKGIPSLAENLMVRRDIALAEYTDSRLHLSNISTEGAVKAVKEAKKKGLKVTASVAVMNLAFDENNLATFDPNYKVSPPLREKSDQKALIKGLKGGTIDFISSNHTPWEAESKSLEFSYAEFGVINLQTAFSLSATHLKGFSTEELVQKWSISPREIFGLPTATIKVGEEAELTAFIPTDKMTFTTSNNLSKSKNSPLFNSELTGKVVGIFNKKQWNLNMK
ncbi:MAG: dihydroorotase [Saprospiraceae bacterium]|jgi:dihydroorotase